MINFEKIDVNKLLSLIQYVSESKEATVLIIKKKFENISKNFDDSLNLLSILEIIHLDKNKISIDSSVKSFDKEYFSKKVTESLFNKKIWL
ncbi:MAG: hypothetical protein WC898_01565 [Candidatus Paceibacterota bacterium]|jgi:hypothetical protein